MIKGVINSLPNDKILDWSKLKAFADDKFNIVKIMEIVVNNTENIVGKGENAAYQHFLLFQQCFLKGMHSRDCLVKGLNKMDFIDL